MNKSDIVAELAEKYSLPKKQAELIVKAIFEEMEVSLKNSERIEFRGFGTFTAREYEGYKGRNPQTGEMVSVTPKRRIRFRMSEVLFSKMNRQFEEISESLSSK